MSITITYEIDRETGEIKSKLSGESSYCSDKGSYYVRPRSDAETWRIEQISENAKLLRKLDEAIAREDARIASCSEEEMLLQLRSGREKKAKERIRMEQFAHAVSELERITDKALHTEIIIVTVGDETFRIPTDEFAAGKFTSLMKELERLDDSFKSDDEENVKAVLKTLVRIEEDIDRCAEQAYDAYMWLLLRTELVQDVIDRLYSAGWTCTITAEGGVSSPMLIAISDAIGNTARLECGKDEEIVLHTPGFSKRMREGLQKLVLGSLHASGATGAKGHCMDEETQDDPVKRTRDTTEPAAKSVRERMK